MITQQVKCHCCMEDSLMITQGFESLRGRFIDEICVGCGYKSRSDSVQNVNGGRTMADVRKSSDELTAEMNRTYGVLCLGIAVILPAISIVASPFSFVFIWFGIALLNGEL